MSLEQKLASLNNVQIYFFINFNNLNGKQITWFKD